MSSNFQTQKKNKIRYPIEIPKETTIKIKNNQAQKNAKAIQLVKHDKNKLILTKEGKDCLSRFPGPLFPIAITGEARKGKSTFLNYLTSYLHSNSQFEQHFQVLSTSESVTSGIWLWNEAIPCTRLKANLKGYILLLDCEGTNLGDDLLTSKLLTLSSLMSSLLILNQTMPLNNLTFDNLGAITQIANIIKKGKNQRRKKNPFPSLLFLMRDYDPKVIDFTIDSEKVSPKEYLIDFLDENNWEDHQEHRKIIKSTFKKLEIFALRAPIKKELKSIAKKCFDLGLDNTTYFSQDLKTCFTELIPSLFETKLFDQQEICGQELATAVEIYIEALNTEKEIAYDDLITQYKKRQFETIKKDTVNDFKTIIYETLTPHFDNEEEMDSIEDPNEIKDAQKVIATYVLETKKIVLEKCQKDLEKLDSDQGGLLYLKMAEKSIDKIIKRWKSSLKSRLKICNDKQNYKKMEKLITEKNSEMEIITKSMNELKLAVTNLNQQNQKSDKQIEKMASQLKQGSEYLKELEKEMKETKKKLKKEKSELSSKRVVVYRSRPSYRSSSGYNLGSLSSYMNSPYSSGYGSGYSGGLESLLGGYGGSYSSGYGSELESLLGSGSSYSSSSMSSLPYSNSIGGWQTGSRGGQYCWRQSSRTGNPYKYYH
ncbi:guanylate binding protein [Anaeramoeba flamelloides]|uniref:Guanylate binding protein n=1 Tax=Anaeramoeba flamelloides TaxID=1746091 RepID=A0AAV7YWJ5_9EUKA|nr:guanylate binding protein [Anaeramoeba flamelloides]